MASDADVPTGGRAACVAACVLAWSMAAPIALAQQEAPGPDPVDVAAELATAGSAIDEARFVDADIALDRAVRGSLSRADLLRWLELRALLSYADGRLGALEETLRGYASITSPGDPLPASFPSPLRQRVAELHDAGERIELAATPAITTAGGARQLAMAAVARVDPGHLVRAIEVRVSVEGAPEVVLAPGDRIEIEGDVHRDVEVRCALAAFGPGGAIVARAGEGDVPLVTLVRGVPRGMDDGVIAAVVVSAVVAIAGAVVIAWGATENWWRGSETHVSGPALIAF